MRFILGFHIIASILLITACSEKKSDLPDNSYYTCPMHPSVRSDAPGACPICGMDLVRKELAADSEHADMVHLTLRQEKRAGIRTDSLRKGAFSTSIEIPGRVVTDPGTRKLMTARIPGKVTKLHVKVPLAKVGRGQPIFEIFSEPLNSDLREYMVIRRRANDMGNDAMTNELVAAARQKLLLWGLTDREINDAVSSGREVTSVFYSDWDGILSNIAVTEGSYVETGQEIIEIASVDRVWIELSGYPGENLIGEPVVKNNMGFTAKGAMVLQSQETGGGQRRIAYVSIENADGNFFPGQEVRVELSGAERSAYLVPRRAVIPGRMQVAWVKTGKGMYEPRMVETGESSSDSIEIIHGLEAGDRIVTEGVYLLNSEYILQKGAGAAHQH